MGKCKKRRKSSMNIKIKEPDFSLPAKKIRELEEEGITIGQLKKRYGIK